MNFNDINITEEKNGDKTYNILMIVADQLSYQLLKADDYCLPAREKLMKKGITFENHYISSAVCTPSRGTIFTGQHPQVSGIFDHMILGYVPSLDPDKPCDS